MSEKKWEEALNTLNAKLDELSKSAAEAAESAKAAQKEHKAELEAKIADAKGDFVALQEQVREAGERGKGKLFSEALKARMTVEAKIQDVKEAKDKKHLERYIGEQIDFAADCHAAALILVAEGKLAALEALAAVAEYNEKFGEKED